MFRKEDFPELSGASNQREAEQRSSNRRQQPAAPTGIVSNGDEMLNLPPSMLADPFGIAGLLQCIRNIDMASSVGTLAIGHDLTRLGLDITMPERTLYTQFGGPFAIHPLKMHERNDVYIRDEYKTNMHIMDKLPQVKVAQYADDLLFYMFYNLSRELYQLAAANELYSRDWRFHKGYNMWIIRSPFGDIKEQTASYELGNYYVFEPRQWRKLTCEMKIEYTDLEDRPRLPTNLQPTPEEREDIQQVQMVLSATLENQENIDPNNPLQMPSFAAPQPPSRQPLMPHQQQ